MLRPHFAATFLLWLLSLVCFTGCLWFSDSSGSDEEEEEDAVKFVLGDLVGDFEPPTLEESEKKVADSGGWEERPVLDSLDLLRERQKDEPQLATVEEALATRNNSDEENAKILSALGRLYETKEDVDFEATITRATGQALNHHNPLLASSTTEFEVSGLTSFGLFSFDWNFTPFASIDAVESWHTSKDGMYDKVVMRDDMTWSDGTPITAHDIEFSYKVIMTEAVPIRAQRTGTEEMKYVKAYDDHTVVYFHKKPLVTNVWNVNFTIIPKHIYEKTLPKDPTMEDSDEHVALEENPITGGSYEVVKRDNVEVVMERRESAYMHKGKKVRDLPHLKTVRLRIVPEASVQLLGLKAGDIDEIILQPRQWSEQTNDDDFYERNTKARGLEWTSFSLQWNSKSPFFSDPKVRWAMTYAFDHEEMLRVHRKGLDKPCTGTFHPASRWYPSEDNAVGTVIEPITRDIDKAKELLDEAGWTDSNGDGYRDKEINGKRRDFEFTIIVRSEKERIDICELLKQNLRQIGVKCNVKPLESATLQDKTFKKQFDAAYGGWGTGADPDTSENIWGTGQQRNFVSYSNEMVDELFEQGRLLEKDRKKWSELKLWQDEETREYLKLDSALADAQPKREDCYAAIHALMWRDQPYTWLFYRNAYHGFSKKLRGYNFSPRGVFGYGPGFGSLWVPSDY